MIIVFHYRSEEHTSELQSHSDLHSFPTRRSSDLPKLCDKGMKKSAQGYTMIWKGYKLHAAVDDHCVPLAVIITSASLNDCEAAIPLAIKSDRVAKNLYDLMDAAYYHPEIMEHSILLG